MEIDLDAIVQNFQTVRRHVAPSEVFAVVKSEAYAHGAVPVARALAAAGVDGLAVALVDEGLQLRRAGLEGPLLVIGATLPAQYPVMADNQMTPVLPDLPHLAAWAAEARRRGERLGYHLKVDVGLGRMGLLPDQGAAAAAAAAELADVVQLEGVSGHLSTPGGDESVNAAEEARFHRFCEPLRARFEGLKRHLAASQAAARYKRMHLELVRIGGLIYGLQHVTAGALDLRAAMTFKSAVAQVRELPAGWSVGYGRRLVVDRPTRMALLPLGWTDVFATTMLNRATVLIRGQRCRLIGLCTDFAMIDATELAEVAVGDEAVIIGRQGAEETRAIELGQTGEISTGQLLGKISLRVPRIYRAGGREAGELSILTG